MSSFATLIVEDTPDIQGSYKRAVERQGGEPVIAATYEEAVAAVERRLFPVALIDVRLSEDDETNVDGLRVLEFIRQLGDQTKAILITGYGSFKIAREAFKKFEVFEGLEKGTSLSVIESTIEKARLSYAKSQTGSKPAYSKSIKGALEEVWEWEGKALKISSPRGGADGLLHFLDTLLHDFVPLLQPTRQLGCPINETKKIAAGLFWSRGQGEAILISFGQKAEVQKLQNASELGDVKESLFEESLRLGPVLKKTESHGVYGIIRKVESKEFASFFKQA